MFFAPDDAQTGPHIVDCANLVVDQTEREGNDADHVLGHVRWDLRRSLRPRDPQSTGRENRAARGVDPPFELRSFRRERHDNVGVTAQTRAEVDAIGNRREQATKVGIKPS